MAADFCFLFHVWTQHDHEQAIVLLEEIGQTNPGADIICISDGADFPEMERTIAQRCLFVKCDRVKLPHYGGLWTKRYMQHYLTLSHAPYLLKIDPDSKVDRSVGVLPNALVFGCTIVLAGLRRIRGGCAGFSRDGVRLLLTSGLLDDGKYKIDPNATYPRYSYWRKSFEPINEEVISLQDFIVADVCDRLSIELHDWSSEVNILFREGCAINPLQQYAIVHPRDL